MKCAACGAAIKHPYYFQGEMYGSECISKLIGVHPNVEYYQLFDAKLGAYNIDRYLEIKKGEEEYQKQKELEYEQKLKRQQIEAEALYHALKKKDLSKISNAFKVKILSELIIQFETKGYISINQLEMVLAWLNKRDKSYFYCNKIEHGFYESLGGPDNEYYFANEINLNLSELEPYPKVKKLVKEVREKGYEEISYQLACERALEAQNYLLEE